MEKAMIDYHCHLLPALDDGATDLDESLKMARILHDFGFTAVHCTPHRIKGCFENEPARVTRTTEILQCLLHEAGIALQLVPGTEHYLDEFLPELLPDALCFGAAKTMLVEVPFRGGSEMLPVMLSQLITRGREPLIAHPERCAAFAPATPASGGFRGTISRIIGKAKEPKCEESLVHSLKRSGCKFQGNLGSFAGIYGKEVKDRALLLLREGIYDCLGSDAHRSEKLPDILAAGCEAIAAEVGAATVAELLAGETLKP